MVPKARIVGGTSSVKVITSHMGNDFDSLASMVAAQKLYPDAKLCLSGSAGRTVREFLKKNASHWTVLTPRKIKFDEITMLIVVDARSRSRIGPFASLLGKKVLQSTSMTITPHQTTTSTANFSPLNPSARAQRSWWRFS